jgi:hypothetical protein
LPFIARGSQEATTTGVAQELAIGVLAFVEPMIREKPVLTSRALLTQARPALSGNASNFYCDSPVRSEAGIPVHFLRPMPN